MKLFTYKDYELNAFAHKDGDDTLYTYEVTKPDGTVISIDVYPLVQMRWTLFRKWVDCGCPDRYTLRQPEALVASDIEIIWDKQFARPLLP